MSTLYVLPGQHHHMPFTAFWSGGKKHGFKYYIDMPPSRSAASNGASRAPTPISDMGSEGYMVKKARLKEPLCNTLP